MRRAGALGCTVALALVGLCSSASPAARPFSQLARARAFVRNAVVLENAAIGLIGAHDGTAAVRKIQLAEGEIRRASIAIAKAPLDFVDEHAIAARLRDAVELDGQSLSGPPDRAVTQLRLANAFKRRALVMIRDVANDGGGIPA